jgi:hypothetical protein
VAWQPLSKILKFVSQGLEKSVEMENLVLPLKDVSDQVIPFLSLELKVHKRENFWAPILKFVLFRSELCRNVKVSF